MASTAFVSCRHCAETVSIPGTWSTQSYQRSTEVCPRCGKVQREKVKLVTLYSNNYRHVAQSLREIADKVEGLEASGVEVEAALVLRGEILEVYGLGAADAGTAHILLGCGQRMFENAVMARYDPNSQ